jgi:hypothetical protein
MNAGDLNERTTRSRVRNNSHFAHAAFVATFEPKDIGHALSDHIREPGSSLYAYSYFSFSHISPSFLSFFLSFIHSLYIFFLVRLSPWKSRTSPLNFLSFIFFKFAPLWTLKLHRTYLLPMLRRCSSSSKEAINKVGTGNIFPLRDTSNLQCWHHLAIFLELMIPSQR